MPEDEGSYLIYPDKELKMQLRRKTMRGRESKRERYR